MYTYIYIICIYMYINVSLHKSVCILGYFGPHFPAFGVNTERYGIAVRILSKCGKLYMFVWCIYIHFLFVYCSIVTIYVTNLWLCHNLCSPMLFMTWSWSYIKDWKLHKTLKNIRTWRIIQVYLRRFLIG